MKILRRLTVPTGDIMVVSGRSNRPLECLSLGDYGKDVNLNQGKSVPDGLPLMPLTKKWVATLSTQYGCSMGCKFCDVPSVGPGVNAGLDDLHAQLDAVFAIHPEIFETERLNLHYARMGEPTFNPAVLEHAEVTHATYPHFNPHPVVSTMMPYDNHSLVPFLQEWMRIKNVVYKGNAGLQISINSTDPGERCRIFNGRSHRLEYIAEVGRILPAPLGRKITLNFAVAGYTVNERELRVLFDPARYIIKLTPMHKTSAAVRNGQKTDGDYTTPQPYEDLAQRLRAQGFEVLVFIASRDEDEGRITCGNAILSGTLPHRFHETCKE